MMKDCKPCWWKFIQSFIRWSRSNTCRHGLQTQWRRLLNTWAATSQKIRLVLRTIYRQTTILNRIQRGPTSLATRIFQLGHISNLSRMEVISLIWKLRIRNGQSWIASSQVSIKVWLLLSKTKVRGGQTTKRMTETKRMIEVISLNLYYLDQSPQAVSSVVIAQWKTTLAKHKTP